MNARCDLRTYHECACENECTQILIDRAPLIRPERQDIKTAIAFGVLVALLVFGGAHVLNHYEIQYAMEARV